MSFWRNLSPKTVQEAIANRSELRQTRQIRRLSNRVLRMEPCEKRNLFAISPSLIAVIPNEGSVIQNGDTLHIGPQQLVFRFDDGQIIDSASLGAITLVRGGGDHVLGNADDVTLTPGYVGIGDTPNDIVLRFASTLPDDQYQIKIQGAGAGALKNTMGTAFNNGQNLTRNFTLDLGAQVVAVVPQPISRDAAGKLSQALDTVDVYFNNDPLNATSAQTVSNYQLIRTNGTDTNADDAVITPLSATYDATLNKVTLKFSQAQMTTAGTYRLRVGNADPTPLAPTTITVAADTGAINQNSSLATAFDSAALAFNGTTNAVQTKIIRSSIDPQDYTLAFPGAGGNEPGHRDIPAENHLLGGADTAGGVPTVSYNFKDVYGADPQGNVLHNLITENQKVLVREIFSFYSHYLGVQFSESPASGFTIVTGDLRALNPDIPTGPGGVAGLAGLGTAIMDLAEPWDDRGPESAQPGKESYFQVAMHEIGHLLGQGHTYDLPPLTIQGSEGENAAVPAEPVFPGDADIIHGQFQYRPDVKDIDMYKLSVPTAGKVDLETFGERLNTAVNGVVDHQVDTVITVFDASGNIVARNDDYFSHDSFLSLQLAAGQYYVGVTAKGNTNYDPNIEDSGFGGTTQGDYELRMTYARGATTGLTDTAGTLLDGDADGLAGGAYNFWFKVKDSTSTTSTTNTIFVDKASTGGVGTLGSLSNPYTNLSQALAAATPNKIVRVVGNSGADGVASTLGDNLAYNIGYDALTGLPLSDGAKVDVPRGVTVMIDAGAIFKMRASNIDVGSSAQGIDRSNGALQVLGTPTNSVYFTSYQNQLIGKDTDPRATTPSNGDFGGLVFRDDSDYESAGIFLNYVNHANISFGGGSVVVNSTPQVFNPVHMVRSRPTVSFNTITNAADAAVSADPNSFEETEFLSDAAAGAFTADYKRVGPDIHGNTLLSNSINALFVRIDTQQDQNITPLTVSARFDDKDIVYYLADALEVQGTPGGTLQSGASTSARLDARLAIDPGVIVKSESARIEARIGGQIIAEGTAQNPVIFTSIFDDTYGGSGTFDTSSDGASSSPAAGNWSGIYFGHLSSGSIDHALIRYAGGESGLEGARDNFNPIEIHQADVRVANSVIESSASGAAGSDRVGRGFNAAAVIYVIGAQPVLINNTIRNNAGAAISINANALNSIHVADYGRTTGRIDTGRGVSGFPTGNPVDIQQAFADNYGPLVRGNRLENNAVNGMQVRGGVLTTESIWDDTDIVHVLMNEIVVPDFHTFGGLRLQSSTTSSLVVKLQGAAAGFTAQGRPLDITDRIGGALVVQGTPGHTVIFTSLADDSVGAGFDPQGKLQVDTNNGAGVAKAGDWRSLKLDIDSNDRNVAISNERESRITPDGDTNSRPDSAQALGTLAADEKSGDDKNRLGFQVYGSIAENKDVDVYSFKATAGSEVWIDIDRTSYALDTVLELVDANGSVVARSDDSTREDTKPELLSGVALRMRRDTWSSQSAGDPNGAEDLYTTNTFDAGMRAVLPGVPGAQNTYYVRVRSNVVQESQKPQFASDLAAFDNALSNVTGGLSHGNYQLQVRLREIDEIPGSSITFADIRYATNGIEVIGKPGDSPLLGEAGELPGVGDSLGNAQDIGDLLQQNRGTISVSGNLDSKTDVDWYKFTVDYKLIQDLTGDPSIWSTIFDVDYADGTGRANTQVHVYDAGGNLIYTSRNSNVADDRPATSGGSGVDDLTRGSIGAQDPFIGSANLLEGNGKTYYVAISSNNQAPQELDQFLSSAATNPLFRLEPVNSVRRIVEDHIEATDGSNLPTATTPLNVRPVSFTLNDVPLFVSSKTDLFAYDPYTGGLIDDVTRTDKELANGPGYTDLAMRNDGRLYTTLNTGGNAGNGHFVELNTGDGGVISNVSSGITTALPDPANPPTGTLPYDAGVIFEAIAHTDDKFRHVIAVGHVPNLQIPGKNAYQNLLYALTNTGAAVDNPNKGMNYINAPTDKDFLGQLFTAPTIVVPDLATDIAFPFNAPGDILDGDKFKIVDADGTTKVFELDGGPDVKVDPLGPAAVRDGNTFLLTAGGVTKTFEFNSGPVLVEGGGGTVADGATFTLTDTMGQSVTFEFDNNSVKTPANFAVTYGINDSAATLASTIVAAINAQGFKTKAAASTGANAGRISLINDTAAAATGVSVTIAGGYGVTAGRTAINFEETDPFNTFGMNLTTTVTATLPAVLAGYAGRAGDPNQATGTTGDRLTFFGATVSDFTGTPAFSSVAGANGPSATGIAVTSDYAIPFKANNTAIELATSIAAIINAASTAMPAFDVQALATGNSVELTGPLAAPTGDLPFQYLGEGPGGQITGLAYVGTKIYAVSEGGGLYTIQNADIFDRDATQIAFRTAKLNYVGTIFDTTGAPAPLSGLSVGPQSVEAGKYARMLFATDSNGLVYAFDTAAVPQAVFADGATSVDTGVIGATGLAFSNVDFNLWHQTTARKDDLGHGIAVAPDLSRDKKAGGTSIYFGLENPDANQTLDVQPGAGNYKDRQNAPSNPGQFKTYDTPGGAKGTLVTDPFSLEGYASADQPTLYFNYYLETENAIGTVKPNKHTMRDSLRVYASTDGATWKLLTTNDALNADPDIGPPPATPDLKQALDGGVQQTFDNSNTWRQARVSLADFAGKTGVRMRFDFSTAGGLNTGSANSGTTLVAIAGQKLDDGDTFNVDGKTFEFDRGFTLVSPESPGSAAVVLDGDTFSVTVGAVTKTFEFDRDKTVTGANVAVPVSGVDTASVIATTIAALLNDPTAGFGPATAFAYGARVNVPLALDLNVTGAPTFLTEGDATGTLSDPLNIPVLINAGMTAAEVAAAIAPVYDAEFVTAAGNIDDPTFLQSIKEFEDRLQIVGHTVFDPGKLGLTRALVGDAFGLNTAADPDNKHEVGTNNHFEGVYLDDFVIGFAERGEMATNAAANSTIAGIGLGAKTDINTGNYDLEIRRGTEYAVYLPKAKKTSLQLDYNTNDRLDQTLTLTAKGGADLVDGDVFLVNDGLNKTFYEFRHTGAVGQNFINGVLTDNTQIDYSIEDSANDIAFRVANAINGSFTAGISKTQATAVIGGDRIDLINAAFIDTGALSVQPSGADQVLTISPDLLPRDGDTFTISVGGSRSVTFEFDTDATENVAIGNVAVRLAPGDLPTAHNWALAVQVAVLARDAKYKALDANLIDFPVTPVVTDNTVKFVYNLQLTGQAIGSLTFTPNDTTVNSQILIATVVIAPSSPILDGQKLKLTLTNPYSVDPNVPGKLSESRDFYFEFDRNNSVASDGVNAAGLPVKNRAVPFTLSSTPAQIAAALAAAIDSLFIRTSTYGALDTFVAPLITISDLNTVLIFRNENTNTSITEVVSAINTQGAQGLLGYAAGDQNLFRDQGYTLISSNRISNSMNFGITVDSAPRDNTGSTAFPGAPRTLREINTARLVPGVSIENNVIDNNAAGGIHFAGDPSTIAAATPFGRIANNTIYGGVTPVGVGIEIANNASPTLLNNIIANTVTAVTIDASSNTTVAISNLTQGNTNLGSLTAGLDLKLTQLTAAQPLFVDPANGDYYLVAGSKAIDSSTNTVAERPALQTVTAPLGIPKSTITAPEMDVFGQFRQDDPTVNSPPGSGLNVFKDRGAIDRVDFVGPTSRLVAPEDNDPAGLDKNAAFNSVQLFGKSVPKFSIQLSDTGTGIRDATVAATKFSLVRNGVTLQPTTDYLYSYDSTNHIVTFFAASGVFPDGIYKINVNNSQAVGVQDIAGNVLQGNNADGSLSFTIELAPVPKSPWQNPIKTLDVNRDGVVAPQDALIIINSLNKGGAIKLPPTSAAPAYLLDKNGLIYYVDTSGDGNLSPLDALLVINALNSGQTNSFVKSAAATNSATAAAGLTSNGTAVAQGLAIYSASTGVSSNWTWSVGSTSTAAATSSVTAASTATASSSAMHSATAARPMALSQAAATDQAWSAFDESDADGDLLDELALSVAG